MRCVKGRPISFDEGRETGPKEALAGAELAEASIVRVAV